MSTARNILITLGSIVLALSFSHSDVNAKSRKKQQLNFEAASEASVQGQELPSSTAPAGVGQSTAIKALSSLNRQKASLQQQANSLGQQLGMTRGSGKKKKITREMEQIATQIKAIDRKIEALPRSVRMGESSDEAEKAAAKDLVNSMIESKLKAQGMTERPNFDLLDEPEPQITQRPVQVASPICYRVQLAAVSKPNISAFRNIPNVEQDRTANGMYVYYHGSFATQSEAEQACRQIRTTTSYRDAFVIATENGQRISLSQAAARAR